MSQGGSHASVVFKSYPDDSNAARFEKHYSRCNKNILKKKKKQQKTVGGGRRREGRRNGRGKEEEEEG